MKYLSACGSCDPGQDGCLCEISVTSTRKVNLTLVLEDSYYENQADFEKGVGYWLQKLIQETNGPHPDCLIKEVHQPCQFTNPLAKQLADLAVQVEMESQFNVPSTIEVQIKYSAGDRGIGEFFFTSTTQVSCIEGRHSCMGVGSTPTCSGKPGNHQN